MAARAEILRELGLLPLWRWRVVARSTVEEPTVVESSRETAPAREQSDVLAPDRLKRIALLDWRGFAEDVDACTACALCRTRNKSVPGVGDAQAQWLFVGE